MGDEQVVTLDMLREAVTHEVRQQMTPYRLQADQDHDDLQQVKWTVFGNAQTGQVGMVKAMQEIRASLEALVKSSEQRQWLQRGIAIGVALNLAQQAGFFDIVGRILKAIP